MDTTTTPDTAWTLPDTPVIPPGRDPLDDLTVGELGYIGKTLKCDPVAAVQNPALGLRWPALAHVAYVWARRTDPHAKLQPFLDTTASRIGELLRFGEPAAGADEVPAEENPTDSPAASL